MRGSGVIGRTIHAAKVGLAARDIRKAATDEDKAIARRALANLFADGRGVTMKFGQLMAGTGDDDIFKDLITSVEPMPLDQIVPVVEQEMGCPIDQVFKEFDASIHAASLGQVHRAVLEDGTVVAVKVQYPFIRDAVTSEMRLFGLMPGVGPVRTWGFDLDGYKRALKANMDRELDYRNEAERQIRFASAVDVPGLIVPKVHEELSGSQILVQDWHTGDDLQVAKSWDVDVRRALGRTLLATLLKSLFEAGEIHGDPHPGNFAFRKDPQPQVVLMDYGCTVGVPYAERMALLKTILALREGTPLVPLDAFAAMGFDAEKLAPISGALATLAHIMFEPFMKGGLFFIHHWDFKRRFEDLLGDNRWWFRSSGPPSHILLLRGFHGLSQQLDTLRAGLDWYQILTETLSDETLNAARAYEMPRVPDAVRAKADRIADNMDLASSLRIDVKEGEREVVSMSMPAEAVLRLEELIPEDVMAYLNDADEWDVPAIMAGIRARGIEPQQVLDFEKGERTYRIWLE